MHLIGLVTVSDVEQLASLLTRKFDVLSLHLTKYVSLAAEQTDKGMNPVSIMQLFSGSEIAEWYLFIPADPSMLSFSFL